jgi:predicted metal-dependent hydrolase
MNRARQAKPTESQRSRRTRTISRDSFKGEVQSWAERIGVLAKEIHIRPMKRKWASCSTTGRFSFNEELLSKPVSFRKEVIVHELLHLKVPNHGRLFKALLKVYTRASDSEQNGE